MQLIAVNKDCKKYGFPETLKLDDDTFKGHQIGVAVCVYDCDNKKIINSFMNKETDSEDSDEKSIALCQQLINDKNMTLIKHSCMQFNEDIGKFVPHVIYYMPYQVVNHSINLPTVNYETIDNCINTTHELLVEILFVCPDEDGICRYLTVPFKSHNVSIMSLVEEMLSDLSEYPDIFPYLEETDEYGEGYGLDFYDRTGHKFTITFKDGDELRDCVNSIRLIDIKTIINDDWIK